MNIKLLLLIFVLSVISVAGQTVAEIEERYGKPTLAYSVTENIWMTPDFAADGQLCRMRFYPKPVIRGIPYISSSHLSHAELKWILNYIVPPSLRGNKKPGFGSGPLSGGMFQAEYEYENVTFTFPYSVNTNIDPKALKKNSEFIGLDFPIVDELPKPTLTPASESDFDKSASPEIVILRWNDRTCVEDNTNEARVAEIEQRFGQPQKIYSVGSFISMTPEFATDGQVCQMWLFPKRVSGAKSYLGLTLEFGQLQQFLNMLVPPEQRGLKSATSFGNNAGFGRGVWTYYPYENVLFTFIAGTYPSTFSYHPTPPKKIDESTISLSDSVRPPTRDRHPSETDFHRADNTEIVNVRWQRRKCLGF